MAPKEVNLFQKYTQELEGSVVKFLPCQNENLGPQNTGFMKVSTGEEKQADSLGLIG